MKLSNDTIAVIEFLDEYSKSNLRKKNDLATLFELYATYLDADQFNRLVFSGKSLWNIYSKFKKTTRNAEGSELLIKELDRCANEITEHIKVICNYADDEIKNRFEDIYLPVTKGGFLNLIDLAHDLSYFKELQTDTRRKSQS
ncbi:MAG: hypothetical protein WCZ17_04600 [Candidatus Kapaibacterium sp.]